MKHIFIVNPTSGNGQYVEVIAQIKAFFKDVSLYEIVMTEYAGHAQEIAERYADAEAYRLYSVGGDGTAHEVLNGLHDGVGLGLIPAGSGNDFIRNLHPKVKFDTIIQDIVGGTIEQIDYIKFNDMKQLNCTNVGLDADINKGVNESNIRRIPRKFLYGLFALKSLIKKDTVSIKITHDGVSSDHEVLLATFMNGRYYGGGFQSAPLANLQDGLLDVTLIEDVSRLRILRLLPIYFQGKHIGIDVVTNFRTTKIEVQSSKPIQVGCDGELEERTEFKLEVVPAGLHLIIPKGTSLQGQSVI